MARKHDQVAKRIAKRLGAEYNAGQGADVQANRAVVEVETKNTVRDALRQLQGHRKAEYVAGADAEATKRAIKRTEGTSVGVMDQHGNVVKRSTRKKGN